MKLKLLSRVWLFVTQWIVAQAPPSMGFSRQEYWSGLPCSHPTGLPNPGIKTKFDLSCDHMLFSLFNLLKCTKDLAIFTISQFNWSIQVFYFSLSCFNNLFFSKYNIYFASVFKYKLSIIFYALLYFIASICVLVVLPLLDHNLITVKGLT